MSHISLHKPTRNYMHVHENTSFGVNSVMKPSRPVKPVTNSQLPLAVC